MRTIKAHTKAYLHPLREGREGWGREKERAQRERERERKAEFESVLPGGMPQQLGHTVQSLESHGFASSLLSLSSNDEARERRMRERKRRRAFFPISHDKEAPK